VKGALLWEPPASVLETSHLSVYQRWLEDTRGLAFASYADLWAWSVANVGAFWETIWQYFDVRSSAPYETPLADASMPGARWFPGARLSYAEHIFRGKDPDAIALVHASELRPLGETTWGQLKRRTAAFADGLEELGVARGDRVAAYLPNIEEAVVAFLACACIGATWSSCSPDFGV